jgi:hypothetical protein
MAAKLRNGEASRNLNFVVTKPNHVSGGGLDVTGDQPRNMGEPSTDEHAVSTTTT